MKNIPIYLKFIQLINALESVQTLPVMSPLEQKLIEIIALMNSRNDRLSVTDLMAHREFGAPATLYKNMHQLIEKGWIDLVPTEDRRRKQIVLTKEAMKHFDKLGAAVLKAVKINQR